MSTLKKFLLDCSGVDQVLLKKCPSDQNKYIGIGATIFFTGLLAAFSASYALYTVFDSYILAALFGIVWGLMIFNLDRYIVSSMKSQGKFFRDLFVALPRIAMAVILALVISKPLELKIFEKEINSELLVMQQETYKTQEDKIKVRYSSQIENYQTEIATLKSENEAKTATRDQLAMMAMQEADGSGGSKIRNMGPIYKAKKQEAEMAQQELNAALAINRPLIFEKETAIKEIQQTVNNDITNLERGAFGGLAARMEALDRLSRQSEAILLANIFVMLMFITVETAPVMVKLISRRSPYDYLLHEHEHVFEMNNFERTSLLENSVRNVVKHDTETGSYKTNAKVMAEKEMIDNALKQRIGDLKQNPLSWEELF
ncbi:MAG: hypothetical protein ACI9VN_001609 [Patescibacteria group bacterium]|jgi:hypothetical protein